MYLELYANVNGTFEMVVSIGDAKINTLVGEEIRQYPIAGTRVVRWPTMDKEKANEAAEADSTGD